jgi:pimeloyl-ACP methyl ester carboxylesterase
MEFPLLLINGIGAGLEVLQPFVDALNPALTVIRFDVPGTGGSPLPQRPYRFGGLCKLIAALLSQLGYETADVLGISWGGAVAQHFAAFQPRRCRLVLVSTATGSLMVPARPSVLLRMATPRRYTDPGYLQRAAPRLYGGSARTEAHQVGAYLHRGQHPPLSSRGYLISSPPRPAGPACRSCRRCGSRCSSCPATMTRSSRCHRGRAAGAGGRALPAPGRQPRRAAAPFPVLARRLKPAYARNMRRAFARSSTGPHGPGDHPRSTARCHRQPCHPSCRTPPTGHRTAAQAAVRSARAGRR